MDVSIEEAIRLAILSRPECFGLLPEDVNPLLRFALRMAAGEEIDRDDLSTVCFDECNSRVYEKLTEVLSYDARAKGGAVPSPGKRQKPQGKASGNGKKGAPKLSVKQLRYLGYLLRQQGDEPDYDEISKLTTTQATMRIKELEAQAKAS